LLSVALAIDKPGEKFRVADSLQARTLRMIPVSKKSPDFLLEALFEHGVYPGFNARIEFWARSVES
jgi:hypothetical protein